MKNAKQVKVIQFFPMQHKKLIFKQLQYRTQFRFFKKGKEIGKIFQHFKSSYKFCSFVFTFIHSAWNPLNLRSFSKIRGFAGGSDSEESACNVRYLGSIPGLGRSWGEWNSYPLQYSGLENSMDRRAWQATVHGVAKSRT